MIEKVKIGLVVLALLFVSPNAWALPFVTSPFSPAGGTVAAGDTVTVGALEIGVLEGGTQTVGIYGAGLLLAPAFGYTISLGTDLATWDTYNTIGGYLDLFAVNINQTDFYWNLVEGGSGTLVDPLVGTDPAPLPVSECGLLPGCTFAWGGTVSADGILDTLLLPGVTLSLTGDPTLPYYLSLTLDTKTFPDADPAYPSFGTFHINDIATISPPPPPVSVPEPATFGLMASGLLFLIRFGRRHA
jgi:hypothetical protein